MKKYPLFLLYICIICCGPKPHVSIERSSIGASSEFWYGNGQANIGDASYQQVARTRALNIIAEQLEVEIKSSIIDVQEQYGVGLGGKGNEYNKVTIESRVNTNLENIEYFDEKQHPSQ